jgi:hypothetical protein
LLTGKKPAIYPKLNQRVFTLPLRLGGFVRLTFIEGPSRRTVKNIYRRFFGKIPQINGNRRLSATISVAQNESALLRIIVNGPQSTANWICRHKAYKNHNWQWTVNR